jgi:DNA-binding MurR/RpiR family transcriptional regulator
MSHNESTAPDVLSHIRTSLDGMSKGQKRVAEFLLTNGLDAVYLSSGRIAELTEVNRSTVVRTAQALGYEGFPDLQAALQRQLLRNFSTADRVRLDWARLNEDLGEGGSEGLGILYSMARSEIRDLENLVHQVSEADFNRAVEALAAAQKIYIVGLRGSLALALNFAFLMQHVRENCFLIEPGIHSIAEQLINLTPDDLLFTISYSRYALDTIRCMDYARRVGAQVITLTDSPISPAAKRADLAFTLVFRMYLYRNTSTPTILLNALVAALSARQTEVSRARLGQLEAIYEHLGVFYGDPE